LLLGGWYFSIQFHVCGFCGGCCEGFLVELLQVDGSFITGLLGDMLCDGCGKCVDSQPGEFI
jgi:hypothetical protein